MRHALTLLEGKWFPEKHVTVMDLFRPLFGVWSDSSDLSCHYEQFTNESAFRASMCYAFSQRRPETIYIGAHGDSKCIYGFHDEGISRTFIRNTFQQVEGTTKRGVFFGSCSFGTEDTARFILPTCDRVSWLAGYEEEVDWTDSSILDLAFMRHMLFPADSSLSRTREKLRYACEQIQTDMGPLAERLGFHAFTRKQGGGIVDFMA